MFNPTEGSTAWRTQTKIAPEKSKDDSGNSIWILGIQNQNYGTECEALGIYPPPQTTSTLAEWAWCNYFGTGFLEAWNIQRRLRWQNEINLGKFQLLAKQQLPIPHPAQPSPMAGGGAHVLPGVAWESSKDSGLCPPNIGDVRSACSLLLLVKET